MDISCAAPCTENEPIPMPVLPPNPGGGGGSGITSVTTQGSDNVNFSGDGTELNPLTATVVSEYEPDNFDVVGDTLDDYLAGVDASLGLAIGNRLVEFEIAFASVDGSVDGAILSAYTPAHEFTLRTGLPESSIICQTPEEDFRINIVHTGSTVVGFIDVISGVPTITFAGDVVFAPHDLLTFVSVGAASYAILAVTLVGERELKYV